MLLLLMPLFWSVACSEEQIVTGVAAESAFVRLLYGLTHRDTLASQIAATELNAHLRSLRTVGYRPLADADLDERMYRFDRAECAFLESLASINGGELDLAAVQLDQAVYEVRAADPPVSAELYVLNLYDFIGAWLEVGTLYADRDAFVQEGRNCAANALREWASIRYLRPDPVVYPSIARNPLPFLEAHLALESRLREVEGFVHRNDAIPEAVMRGTSEALWNVLLLFGGGETARTTPKAGSNTVTPAAL
ncbi:hypothetical protein CLV84_0561 [Neolewinella xylanilytica]|uniref:Uncharacterized protein n=2 Tax=Neolewinella xylanilytica TaxID=1514080 RepID=A0A2S6I7Z6_9BACT|nr:hypothetical protein CLV84_0561 [Neolewinella xylanilytica]